MPPAADRTRRVGHSMRARPARHQVVGRHVSRTPVRLLLSMLPLCAIGVLEATTASGYVDVHAPDRSVYCQQPIQLGIARDYRRSNSFWARISVRTETGRVLRSWSRTAPRKGWLYWTYIPPACGRKYVIVYVLPGYTSRFMVTVSHIPVGFGAP